MSQIALTDCRQNQDKRPRPAMLLIAGFGDDSSMFTGLSETSLVNAYDLIAIDLPGFGAPGSNAETTLDSLGKYISAKATEFAAEVVVAHSVASIIASLAANEPDSPITTILSLEGNITADDAYFSGTAAGYDDPNAFKSAFLARLKKMSESQPIIKRYHSVVSKADPIALWQLGSDAHRFSSKQVPGELLISSANATYFYNPDNCPQSTLEWLKKNPIEKITLDHATHWVSVSEPNLLSEKILSVMA